MKAGTKFISHTPMSLVAVHSWNFGVYTYTCVYTSIMVYTYIHTYKEFFPHNLDFTVDSVANEFVS